MGVQWRQGMQHPLLRRRSRTWASSTIDGGDVGGGGCLLGRLVGDRGRRGAAPSSRDGGKAGVWRCRDGTGGVAVELGPMEVRRRRGLDVPRRRGLGVRRRWGSGRAAAGFWSCGGGGGFGRAAAGFWACGGGSGSGGVGA
jgi:hypothetical protein